MIQVYTGTGKGKTTASIGQLIRHIGYGNSAIYAQFLKTTTTGEVEFFIKNSTENVLILRNSKAFPFSNKMHVEQKIEITKIHNEILHKSIMNFNNQEYSLLVLDEIISTYNLELIDKKLVVDFLKSFPKEKEVILTGRDCPQEFLNIADYISDINSIRNPFDSGVIARKGIEY